MAMSETIELDQKSDPQAVKGYAFYDWAKSAFETSVTVAVLHFSIGAPQCRKKRLINY